MMPNKNTRPLDSILGQKLVAAGSGDTLYDQNPAPLGMVTPLQLTGHCSYQKAKLESLIESF